MRFCGDWAPTATKEVDVTGLFALSHVRRMLLLFGLVFAALPVGSALADTTIGQVGGNVICTPPGGEGVAADTNYVVPSGGGRITSFSFQSTSANNGDV